MEKKLHQYKQRRQLSTQTKKGTMSQNTNKKPLVDTKQKVATRRTNLTKPRNNKKETENISAPCQRGKISERYNLVIFLSF